MSELRTEAARLLDVLTDRLTALRNAAGADFGAPPSDRAGSTTTGQASGDPAPPHQDPSRLSADLPAGTATPCATCGHGSAETTGGASTGCPLCALLAVLRGERPDVAAGLLDGALKGVIGLRTLLGEPPADPSGDGRMDDQHLRRPAGPGPQGAFRTAPGPRRPAERIHIA